MKKLKGFTLVEILIALSIFAILATISSSAIYYSFKTRDRLTEEADFLASIQLAVSLLMHDTSQAIARQIRADDMLLFQAFIGTNNYTEFTHTGIANPGAIANISSLERVAWICTNNQLKRRSWLSLDPINRKNFQEKVILTDLTNCNFAYLDKNLQLLDAWHGVNEDALPRAIQISLAFNKNNKTKLLFILPDAIYVNI